LASTCDTVHALVLVLGLLGLLLGLLGLLGLPLPSA
jgi:hypothetical protein